MKMTKESLSGESHRQLRDELVAIGKRVYARGYVASNDGNISVRLDENRILISPTGVSKGFMQPDDLVITDMSGNLLHGGKKPSTELSVHTQIYKARPDVKSICHAHPPYATGFAVAGMPLGKMVLPEMIIALGTIPLVKYGTTGTSELYGAIADYIHDYDAFLLANHGVLTVGGSLLNAYYKMETLEHAAMIQFIAHQLGVVNELDQTQVKKLIELRGKFGIKKDIGLKSAKRP